MRSELPQAPLAVIGVFSAAPYRVRRDAIRATWFQYSTPILTRFVVATNASANAALTSEAARHSSDLVLIQTNVTTRDWGPYILMWHWLATATARWPAAAFVGKCDDDGYIMLPELASQLAMVHAHRLPHVYYGNFMWTSWHTRLSFDVASATTAQAAKVAAKKVCERTGGGSSSGVSSSNPRDAASSSSNSSSAAHKGMMQCDGPFTYGTAPLQVVGRDLAMALTTSERAVSSIDRSLAAIAELRRRGVGKPGPPAFEDAWLGHAIHALLPPGTTSTHGAAGHAGGGAPATPAVNITLVGLHSWCACCHAQYPARHSALSVSRMSSLTRAGTRSTPLASGSTITRCSCMM